ncbi:MAG: DNA-directed DNA polymerase II small subunit [Halobacteriales archaeon]
MPLDTPVRVVRELAERGYNAEREAVTLLANAPDPERAIERAIETAPEGALTLTPDHARDALEPSRQSGGEPATDSGPNPTSLQTTPDPLSASDPSSSTGPETRRNSPDDGGSPVEMKGVAGGNDGAAQEGGVNDARSVADRTVEIRNDVTGESTGTGVYEDFVATFRDRYERLSGSLRSRVNHRPASAIAEMSGGSEAGIVGMVSDVRSTANGHRLVELEDTTGVFPCLITKDKGIADLTEELLLDEVIAIEGRLADDGGVLFADSLHFPDVPRTFEPSTADRHVRAALVSDVHVGSEEFLADAWHRFADWLHTEDARDIEYLVIAGDMIEGVGVYPGQDEELDIVDVYEQYEAFSELLKEVPGDIEIVMIPGNHDAVRLAEPQPAFDAELRDLMSAHDARFAGNPSFVTLNGVTFLVYHGVSLDEVIAEIPGASYDEPQEAMSYLLKKRHVAPQYGGSHIRIAPEEGDYLVIDEVPDVFHTGHVHKLGYGRYHNVTTINSGCWQAQTGFQESVNIEPDFGYAPIVDLDTLEVTIRKFV